MEFHKEWAEHHREGVEHHKEGAEHHKEGAEHHKGWAEHQKEGAEHHKEGVEHHKEGVELHKEWAEHHREGVEHHKEGAEHHKGWAEHQKEGVEPHREGPGGTFGVRTSQGGWNTARRAPQKEGRLILEWMMRATKILTLDDKGCVSLSRLPYPIVGVTGEHPRVLLGEGIHSQGATASVE